MLQLQRSLSIICTLQFGTFCIQNERTRVVKSYQSQEPYEIRETLESESVEIHYSISGVNNDEVMFSVYKMVPLPSNPNLAEQQRVFTDQGKPDGYRHEKYEGSNMIEMCFTRTDKNKKEITFLVNQLTAG